MARKVLDAGILPHTLGADMHGYNTRLPSDGEDAAGHMFAGAGNFSLTSAMTGLMACGVPLEDIVPMVTNHAAQMLGLDDEIGTLRPGAVADVSVLADERGRWVLRDNEGTEAAAERMLRPLFCLRAGRRFDADAPILPMAQAA
jgi:dihydroorotase